MGIANAGAFVILVLAMLVAVIVTVAWLRRSPGEDKPELDDRWHGDDAAD